MSPNRAPIVDLHTHVLPDVDDGASDFEEALLMVQLARADGVTQLVATPHVPHCRLGCEALKQHLSELQDFLARHDAEIGLTLGTETFVDPDMPKWLGTGRACPIGSTRYVLVELPFVGLPFYVDQIIFQLQVDGYRPVLVHPERNSDIAMNARLLEPFVERGVLVQITGSSLLGDFGPGAQNSATELLQRGMAHVLASDAHSATHRPPILSEAVQKAEKIIGDAAWDLVSATPQAILNDEWIDVEPPLPPKRRRRWF